MNSQVFQKFGDSLRTVEAYTWSKKEATSAGSTIEELLDFGIERPKYSCDVAGAFLKVVSYIYCSSLILFLFVSYNVS